MAHPRNAVGAIGSDEGAGGMAKWLCLAATPTFALMALVSAASGGPMEMLCSSGPMSALSGMVPMYLLMSAFHLPPWLKLIFGR